MWHVLCGSVWGGAELWAGVGGGSEGCAAGYDDAKALARREADLALSALQSLPVCDERRSLEAMVDYVLERMY